MQETQETWVWSLGWEDPLEGKMATHSSILAWRIPWTEEPGGLPFIGSTRVGHAWAPMHPQSVLSTGGNTSHSSENAVFPPILLTARLWSHGCRSSLLSFSTTLLFNLMSRDKKLTRVHCHTDSVRVWICASDWLTFICCLLWSQFLNPYCYSNITLYLRGPLFIFLTEKLSLRERKG